MRMQMLHQLRRSQVQQMIELARQAIRHGVAPWAVVTVGGFPHSPTAWHHHVRVPCPSCCQEQSGYTVLLLPSHEYSVFRAMTAADAPT